jgi:hypothetical protein
MVREPGICYKGVYYDKKDMNVYKKLLSSIETDYLARSIEPLEDL